MQPWGFDMKKVLVLAAVAGAAYFGYRKWQEQAAEDDLWAEATDPLSPTQES